jgi:hypothetical protein
MHREVALVTQGPAAQHESVVVKDQPPVGQQRHTHVRADGQTMRVRAPGHHALRRVSLDSADVEGKAHAGYDAVAVDLLYHAERLGWLRYPSGGAAKNGIRMAGDKDPAKVSSTTSVRATMVTL